MKRVTFLIAAAILLLVGTTAHAHPHGRTTKKQYNQHKRIQHGVRTGQLTRREAGQLRMQQARVRNYKHMAMADGRVTRKERVIINRAQRRADQNIYRQKHDRQTRRW